ncbi:GGDEF domain-containing protein [Micromonospora sp. M42]|uniref:bifunctional diguanylate cyclase/phosphodiesterase n=1 Tax=Micromonospora sp. M42 TaxID=457406 RepID=UPI001CB79C31|nr:GGDEF domain-containing protein [Micromonospora sp. M42]
MPVPPPAGPRRRPPLPDVAVSLTGAVFLLAGVAGLLPGPAATALAVAGGSALACVRLAWLAGGALPAPSDLAPNAPPTVDARTAESPARSTETGPPERRDALAAGVTTGRQARRVALSRRVAAILDAAVLVAGLSVAVLPLSDPAYRLPIALTGLCLTAPLYVTALLRLPGRSRLSGPELVRRTVDVLALGVSLVFAGWMLLPGGPVPAAAGIAASGGAVVLAVLVVAALAERHRRPGAARCHAGAALTLGGADAACGAAGVRRAGPGAAGRRSAAAGGGAADRRGPPACLAGERPDRDVAPAAWPRLTAPAGIAALAAGVHLCVVGEFSTGAMALGLTVVPPIMVGELLAAADQRRRVQRLAAREAWLRRRLGPDARAVEPAPLTRADLVRALAQRNGGALLVVDLHGEGAAVPEGPVLTEVARRLRAGVEAHDLVARLGDAEYAVLTDVGPVLAYALGTRLLAALTEPYPRPGGVARVRVSVGLAETGSGEPEDVLRQADLARRRAVQLGRDRVEWYDAYLEEQLVRRLDLERELPGAVARGELDLVYQPVVALAERTPVGTEALLRWRSPTLGTVLPAELLPVAADLDLVGEIGRWVVDRACRQLAAWSGGGRELWMAVNVTPRELAAPDFVARTATALAAYDVSPERLVVEVAEPGVGAELSTVVARLAGLRSIGVRTALDDFRAEHASLAQLRRLPIDLLKVGPHLVRPGGDGQRPLIDVVANLADRLGVELVVEELESEGQVAGARRAGCRYGQGFALARPATAERVEAWFEEFPSAAR